MRPPDWGKTWSLITLVLAGRSGCGGIAGGIRIVRQHTTTPLAVGEVFNSVWDAHLLIGEQVIDYIRMTVVHGGGITPLKKIAALADIYHVRTGFHGATDLSPVAMAAALHFRYLGE